MANGRARFTFVWHRFAVAEMAMSSLARSALCLQGMPA